MFCQKCHKLAEWYMLNDDVWNKVCNKNDLLCISCFEKKLGRHLTKNDFQQIPLNFGFHKKYHSNIQKERIGEENYWKEDVDLLYSPY